MSDVVSNTTNITEKIVIKEGVMGEHGLSSYQVWLAQGNVGTEKNYLDSLAQPALDVANLKAAELNTLEQSILSQELARKSAEDARVLDETIRTSNESLRELSENTRVSNESTRESDEAIRSDNESTRSTNESKRVVEENKRALSEFSRVTEEGKRVNAETVRASAEDLRATAEKERQTQFNDAQTDRTNQFNAVKSTFEGVVSNAESQVEANILETAVEEKFNNLEQEYAEDLTLTKTHLAETKTEFQAVIAGSTDGDEVINARGIGNLTLKDRLDGSDAQLAETEQEIMLFKEEYANLEGVNNEVIKPLMTTFIKTGKNIFDKSAVTVGKRLEASGNLVIDSGFNITDYIYVSPNTNYAVSNNQERTFFYSIDKILIGSFATWNTSGTFTTPVNCYYIRTNVRNANLDTFQIELGSVATAYEKYILKITNIEPDITRIKKGDFNGSFLKDFSILPNNLDFVSYGKNLYNKYSSVKGYQIVSSGAITANVDAYLSDFIPVEANTQYTINMKKSLVFYDQNKTRISGIYDVNTFTTPISCCYIRTSLYLEGENNYFQLERGASITEYESFKLGVFTNTPIKVPLLDITENEKIVGYANLNDYMRDGLRVGKEKELTLYGHTECNVPTYDGNLNVCHPSVFFVEEGWNGYKYWMGMTPYPEGTRENPSILASNDGYNWIVPRGLKNPIFSQQQANALGYGANSDTHLIMVDNKLRLYWRSMYNKGECINLAESTDGLNWGISTEILAIPNTLGIDGVTKEYISMMSPSVLVEDDGTFTMWYTNQTKNRINMIEKRTSADGITWSNAITCTSPDVNFSPYHLDVKKYNNIYHMLLASNSINRLRHLTSNDGVTWQYNAKLGIIPLSGFEWDKNNHYRSSLLPKTNGKFDLWINGIRTGELGGTWSVDAHWRIAYYRDVDLINGKFPQIRKTRVFYGTALDAPTSTDGFNNGDRYEYTNPLDFVGKIVVNGVWKDFGAIV